MPKPRIIYDKTCPVCTSFMYLVKKKVGDRNAEYYGTNANAQDFEYINAAGKSFKGVDAIEAMGNDFPAVKEYMFMLPPAYKTAGLKVAYKVGSVVRKAYGAVKKGCNCGKKK